jgi:ADP-ribosylglycohydrolase
MSMTTNKPRPKVYGNVLRGVALGDAWGDKHEFSSIKTICTKNKPMGCDIPALLDITDDTQMTLYLASALDETWDAPMAEVKEAIADAFLAYRVDPDTPSRAPGGTVMGSLGKLSGKHLSWQEATHKTSDGSGTVMRTSPTAFLPEDRWVGVTAFAAAITHGNANGITAAILNVAILRELLTGRLKPGNVLDRALTMADSPQMFGLTNTGGWLEDFESNYDVDLRDGFKFLKMLIRCAQIALPTLREDPWGFGSEGKDPAFSDPSMQVGLWDNPNRGGGWRSPHALVIAMLALDTFPEDGMQALRRAVMTDGDSDTIGAVAGALVGAAFPTLFVDQWNDTADGQGTVKSGLRLRFEARYVRWIENEADDYPPAKKGWMARMLAPAA